MGGHAAGEVASRVAVETIESFVVSTLGANEQATWPNGFDPSLGVDGTRLSTALRLANRAVGEEAARQAGTRGMATTAVALLVSQPSAGMGRQGRRARRRGKKTGTRRTRSPSPARFVAHVGDSRAYVWRDGRSTARRAITPGSRNRSPSAR